MARDMQSSKVKRPAVGLTGKLEIREAGLAGFAAWAAWEKEGSGQDDAEVVRCKQDSQETTIMMAWDEKEGKRGGKESNKKTIGK